ncbi:site-specific integrase [Saccharopolyspora sp. NPDC000995]
MYGTYWKRVATEWGERRLDEPTPLEIKRLAEKIRSQVVVRRNARGGRGAAEHLIAALRCLYNHAVDDGVISEADNPAKKVPKPRRCPVHAAVCRTPGWRRSTTSPPPPATTPYSTPSSFGCTPKQPAAGEEHSPSHPEIWNPDQCLSLLHEKGGTVRWQPVSPTLMPHLRDHAEQRGAAASGGQLLRYTNADPITTRRYDHLFTRLGKHLPWVATQQISIHWLRHTTLTWVERNFGYAVARAFAGHTNNSDSGTTTTYTRASIHEIASALAALTGEPHPLTN